MNRLLLLISVLLLLVTGLPGCGPVNFVSTWKNPAAVPVRLEGQKVAAFVVTLQKAARYPAEDTLAEELTKRSVQGIPAYRLIPEGTERDQDKAKELLAKEGVTGAVMMRLVGRDLEVYSSPGTLWYSGPQYPSFWGYYGWGWSVAYMPGHMTTDTVISVETMVYSLEQDRLLWAGLSKTTNPKNVNQFISDLVKIAGKEFRKAGLVEK